MADLCANGRGTVGVLLGRGRCAIENGETVR